MILDLIKGLDLEALEDSNAWLRFVWDGVSNYWVSSNDLTHLNRILLAALKIDRYKEIAPVLIDISTHTIDVKTGLFKKGVVKSKRARLSRSWHSILSDRIGRPAPTVHDAASLQKATVRHSILAELPQLSISDTIRLWKNCITYLSEDRYKSRWSESRAVIDAINQEWVNRRVALPQSGGYFEWPDIDAVGGDGSLSADWLEEGLLSHMGYHVGNTHGVCTTKRRLILKEVFGGAVPPVFPKSYLDSWGDAGSAGRLKKMAETVAAFIRNAKRRRNAALAAAIDQWADDMEFLYHDIYVGKFHFAWPKTGE